MKCRDAVRLVGSNRHVENCHRFAPTSGPARMCGHPAFRFDLHQVFSQFSQKRHSPAHGKSGRSITNGLLPRLTNNHF